MEEIECPTCGEKGFGKEADMKNHHAHAHGESIAQTTLECEQCGEEYEIPDAWVDKKGQDARFCSRECHAEWKSENWKGEDSPRWEGAQTKHECENCGDVFNRPEAWTRKKDRKNDFCCNKCKYEYYSGEGSRFWEGGLDTKGYPRRWQASAEEIRRRDDYECQNCGKSQAQSVAQHGRNLNVHHIDQNKMNMSADNLTTLCPPCHRRIHNRLMEGEDPLEQSRES